MLLQKVKKTEKYPKSTKKYIFHKHKKIFSIYSYHFPRPGPEFVVLLVPRTDTLITSELIKNKQIDSLENCIYLVGIT